MKTKRMKPVSVCIASVLALAVGQAVQADTVAPNTVVVAGATLFQAFWNPAKGNPSLGSNDFIDVNGNSQFGFNGSGPGTFVEQLAPVLTIGGNGNTGTYAVSDSFVTQTPYMNLVYRSVGSVNGLQELLNTGAGVANPFSTTPLAQVAGVWVNQTTVVTNGIPAYSNSSTASGMPNFVPISGTDIAVMDVPSKWGLQASGTAAWNKKPTQAGYGTNNVISIPNNGSTWANTLVSPTANGITFTNTGTGSHVLYDTKVAAVAISPIANPGVGRSQITQTELQMLEVTGRMPNGENLQAATRSVGSGTRNGFANSLGVDPSFAIGENVGAEQTGNPYTKLGATFQASNLSGTGDMQAVVTNDRLSVGYVGSDTAAPDANANKYAVLSVAFNANNTAAAYIEPSLNSILHNNGSAGWLIGGVETFVTIGDPNSTAWAGSSTTDPVTGVTNNYTIANNQTMANSAAALYIRNITESIKNYSTPVGISSTSNYYMPGQYMAESFLLTSATDYVQNATDGTFWQPNTGLNSAIQNNDMSLSGLHTKFDLSRTSSNFVTYGLVPNRNPGVYSDTSTTGTSTGAYRYFDGNGTSPQYAAGGSKLNARNNIMGDFNNTGVRDITQIPAMMAAVADPNAWAYNNRDTAHTSVGGNISVTSSPVPEILGDFNGDGTFNANDIRYFADGLAIQNGQLNRKAGFTAVDNNWTVGTPGHPAGNYFNTTLATGKPYQAGDSRGDIAGSAAGPTAGGAPTGADGLVNAKDIDYEWAQARGAMGINPGTGAYNSDGSFGTLLTRAITDPSVNVRADLSADMNGDMKINQDDVTELVTGILGTQFGDANLDRSVNFTDFLAMLGDYNKPGDWAQGDFNGDGVVNFSDFLVMLGNYGHTVSSSPSLAPAAVPEPASLAVLGLGVIGLMARSRRRRA